MAISTSERPDGPLGRARVAAAAVVAVAFAACGSEPPTSRVPVVSAPPPPDTEFEDQRELLESIEEGSFAEQVELPEPLETLSVPPPARIDFVSGTRVPADQEDELALLVEQLRENEQLLVDLVGCSDPSGSEAVNLRISQARAESVAKHLAELGLSAERIGVVEGRGESCETRQRMVRAIPRLREAEPRDGA